MDTTHLLVTDLEVDTALAEPSVPLAIRTVWQLLRESDVRLSEAVALDVPDVELTDRVVVLRETKEGGVFEADVTSATATQLDELIGTRQSGPVFTIGGRRLRADEVAATFRKVTGKSVHALCFTRQVRSHRETDRPTLVERAAPGQGSTKPA
ncbi:hypothetical protein [Streptomyces sp. TRM68367]|uniref:hypothetical protein n=1 Tax=Streptomyces sp. TRM68367 TaxID=2758415 RepID=UPI00165A672E|nr:hypothetical protein [Streptomyces sp. TRM68367]MBC9724943.1 hypothetical protein [Streptomyces sp. TRM68367]